MSDGNHAHDTIRLQTLGWADLTRKDGTRVDSVLSQPKRLALLVYLAVANRGAFCRRDSVLGVFWPEFDQERARAALRKALHFLRRELGDGVIVTRGDEEIGVDADLLLCDVTGFRAAAAGDEPERALAAYQGDFLSGFHLSDPAEFEHWTAGVRSELREIAVRLARDQTEAAGAESLLAAVRWAWEWVRLAPADETAAKRLITLLHATDDRAGALHAYETIISELQSLGLDPSPETRALAERVREPASGASVLELQAPVGAEASFGATRKVVSRRTVALFSVVLVAGATLGGVGWWRSYESARWARWEAFADIEALVDEGDFEAAHRLAHRAASIRPQDSALSALWRSFTQLRSVTSDPPGASVYRRDYFDTLTVGELLGVTPLDSIRIPRGASRLRFEKDGFETVDHIAWWDNAPPDIDVRLDSIGQLPDGMVRVARGPSRWWTQTDTLADFFIDRYEVTNEEYQQFVLAGGYSRLEFWEHSFVDGADTLTWTDATSRFVDATGRPGPATWEAGTFPDGHERYPVSGISWYEAAAYARFVGKELVTGHHWYRAYERQLFAWIFPTSNLAGDGPAPVGAFPGMSTYGSYDMAGNVREWLANGRGDLRLIAGASWEDDGQWIARTGSLPPALDRSRTNGFRLALYPNESDSVLAVARRPVPDPQPPVDYARLVKPVPDERFALFRRFYEYGSIPLKVAIEVSDTTRRWVYQRISFDAGYPEDRVILHLFLPNVGAPPYQTVVYFSGGAFSLEDFDEYPSITYDFIIKSGRAFAFPEYRGLFSRRFSGGVGAGAMENTTFMGKDLIRTVEYLSTRPDIDTDRLAYYGYTGGVAFAPIALAMVDRFKAAVLLIGGWDWGFGRWNPEVSPLTYIHRVTQPILLMSGRYDYAFDLEKFVTPWLPYFGTPPEHIRHVIADGGHFIPRPQYIREILDWLDKYLGPVDSPETAPLQP